MHGHIHQYLSCGISTEHSRVWIVVWNLLKLKIKKKVYLLNSRLCPRGNILVSRVVRPSIRLRWWLMLLALRILSCGRPCHSVRPVARTRAFPYWFTRRERFLNHCPKAYNLYAKLYRIYLSSTESYRHQIPKITATRNLKFMSRLILLGIIH